MSDQQLHYRYRNAAAPFKLGIAIGNVLVASGVKPRGTDDRLPGGCNLSRVLLRDLADEYERLFRPKEAGVYLPVSVNRGLPKPGDTVLVYGRYPPNDSHWNVGALWDIEFATVVGVPSWEWRDLDGDTMEVTHWAPLPPEPAT